jgi:hypothetical protein
MKDWMAFLMIGNMSRVEEGKAHGLLAIDLKEGKC